MSPNESISFRKNHLSEQNAVVKFKFINFTEGVGDADAFQGRKIKKCTRTYLCDSLWKMYFPQRSATIKCVAADPEECGGKTSVLQQRAGAEYHPSNFYNSFLKHHLFQTTAVLKRAIWEHSD